MVIESCEYTDSFLKFHPTHAIITNIEAEHLDYFKTLENERASYKKFTDLLPADGILTLEKGIPDYDALFKDVKCPVITYSAKDSTADYYAKDITVPYININSIYANSSNNDIKKIFDDAIKTMSATLRV